MKKPLPVPIETGCYYELPTGTCTADMKNYEKWAAGSFGNFVTRSGRKLFFNFTSTKDRDSFLNKLEVSLKQTGCIVKRTFIN
jgi:hypothetical protein